MLTANRLDQQGFSYLEAIAAPLIREVVGDTEAFIRLIQESDSVLNNTIEEYPDMQALKQFAVSCYWSGLPDNHLNRQGAVRFPLKTAGMVGQYPDGTEKKIEKRLKNGPFRQEPKKPRC